MTLQERYAQLTPEERTLLARSPQWLYQVETGEDLDILLRALARDTPGGPPAPSTEPRVQGATPGNAPLASGLPGAATGPQRAQPVVPSRAEDDVSSTIEEPPYLAALKQQADQPSLLRSLAEPFQRTEGKLRLLELLAGAGQGWLSGRAAGKAQERTASSQARANLVGALARRGGGQGVQYQPTQGVGQTLLGALAGAGRMGREVIQEQRELARQARGETREETRLGLEGERVGLEGERVGLEKTGQAAEIAHQQKTEGFEEQRIGLEKERNRLEDARNRTSDARQQALLDRQLAALDEQIRHNKESEDIARKRLASLGAHGGQQTRQQKIANALGQAEILEEQLGKAEMTGPLLGRLGSSILTPELEAYESSRVGVAQLIATSLEGRATEGDRAAIMSMIPAAHDTEKSRKIKWGILKELLRVGEQLRQNGYGIQPGAMPQIMQGAEQTGKLNMDYLLNSAVPLPEDQQGQGSGPEPLVEEVAKQDWLGQ